MLPFATEFPVKKHENRALFVAEVLTWLRGIEDSTILDANSEKDLEGESAHLRSGTGEELRFIGTLGEAGFQATGFRHDFPDSDGRIWRTEGVLRRADDPVGQDVVRFRTQCLAGRPGAYLETPRKPYLIKALLKAGWGDNDGPFIVSDQPIWLQQTDEDLAQASAVTTGEASPWLPVVYVSATGNGDWLLSSREIEKLAYDLGGLAHVVVEPNRTFSFRLRDECQGRNVYGGTVGISIPNQGFVRRLYLGWQLQDGRAVGAATRQSVIALRGQMPALGWDWADLQERSLRSQRHAAKGAMSATDADALFDEFGKQLDELKAENQQLKNQIAETAGQSNDSSEGDFTREDLVRLIGPEVYRGEISDRLRLAAVTTLASADAIGLDSRTRLIMQRITDRLKRSRALDELHRDLDRATKDPKRVAAELISLLERHGYREKSDNKHIRLEPCEEFDGLDSITLPKTPSENRGLQNLRKQIERTLGLGKLPD